jgi:hypothetical protein
LSSFFSVKTIPEVCVIKACHLITYSKKTNVKTRIPWIVKRKMLMIIKDATIWFEINNILFFLFVPATIKQKLQFKNLLRKQKMIWTILLISQHIANQKYEYSQTNRPEITIEDIKHSDELVQFYTGLPDYATFNAVYSSIVQHGADRMEIDNKEITNSVSSRTLRLIDEFLMVMMRLRLGFLLIDLQHRFKVSSGRISRVFTAWIKFMHSCFNELIKKKKNYYTQYTQLYCQTDDWQWFWTYPELTFCLLRHCGNIVAY